MGALGDLTFWLFLPFALAYDILSILFEELGAERFKARRLAIITLGYSFRLFVLLLVQIWEGTTTTTTTTTSFPTLELLVSSSCSFVSALNVVVRCLAFLRFPFTACT